MVLNRKWLNFTHLELRVKRLRPLVLRVKRLRRLDLPSADRHVAIVSPSVLVSKI